MKKNVTVLGLGYIGLPTAIVAAEHGYQVIGFDINHHRLERLQSGDAVIQEPETGPRLRAVLATDSLVILPHIQAADYFIIAVPTPHTEQHTADLAAVQQAFDFIMPFLKSGCAIILESTVPVGTTQRYAQYVEQKTGLREGIDFFCVHCPERVLPGKIFHELVHNPRVIGGVSPASTRVGAQFYKQFVQGSLYLTNAPTAEMVKLIENSYRDVNIAFAHQVAEIAATQNIDPYTIIELANKHPRVNILQPRCGVGGHCIAVDPWFLIETFPQQTALLQIARAINDERPHAIAQTLIWKANQWYQQHHTPCTIGLLGLTYKPDVDDLRESPALVIAQELQRSTHINLVVCEPHINDTVLATMGMRNTTLAHILKEADIVVTLVGHTGFKKQQASIQTHANVYDYCGLFHQEQLANLTEYNLWPTTSVQHKELS